MQGRHGRAKVYTLRYVRAGSEPAPVEDKAGVFLGIVFCLCGNIYPGMGRAMNFAVIEDSFAVAQDEIDVPGNVIIGEIPPRGNAVGATS